MASTDPAPEASSRRSSGLVAAGIFLSRISGLVRAKAFAHWFGTGAIADAFNAALRIPNLLQNLFGEGVLSASFIPVYSRLVGDRDEQEAGRLAGAVAGLLSVLAAVLVVIGVVFAAPLTDLFASGYGPERRGLTVTLVRIMFPGIGLLVLSAWCLGILNSHRRFFLSYVAPVLWNVAQISALVAFGLAGTTGEDLAVVLAWAVVVGSALQFLVQVPQVLRLVPGLRLGLDRRRESVRRVLRAFWPILAGRGVVQLLALVDLMMASYLALGAVSSLQYAQTLYLIPISLFGMAVAAAELPELSRASDRALEAVAERLDEGLARIAFFVVPTVVLFVVLGDRIVATLFGSGEFDLPDVRLVWFVLIGYSVGLVATTSSRLYQSALYGLGEAKLPARAAAVRVLVAASFGAALMLQLDRVTIDGAGTLGTFGDLPATRVLPIEIRESTGFRHLGAVGLSLAAGASSWIEASILRRRLRRDLGRDVRPGGGHLLRTMAAGAAAGPVALGARLVTSSLPHLVGLALAGGAAVATYLVVGWALALPEARHLASSLRRRS